MEKLIREIVKEAGVSGGSHSQMGDTTEFLRAQGFLNYQEYESLKSRDKFLTGGNPIDVRKIFEEQNEKIGMKEVIFQNEKDARKAYETDLESFFGRMTSGVPAPHEEDYKYKDGNTIKSLE